MRNNILPCIGLAILLADCAVPSTPAPSPIAATAIAIADTTRVPATPTLTATSAITLTLWTTEDFAPGSVGPGAIWRDQFASFHAANPNIALDVILKKADGKGGILDALTTTRAVVPSLMPDVTIVNLSDAAVAAEKKIIQPLDGIVSAEFTLDRFPFAAQSATYQNQWVAIPFAADVQHLVYTQTVPSSAPKTWDDLARQKNPLLLPLGGDDAFLLQYYSFGASLGNFDPYAAAQVFGLIKRGHDLNFLPEAALNARSADDSWDAFATGQVAMAQVWGSRYWAERNNLAPNLNASFAPIPTRDGRSATLVSGWALAIVTNDALRQRAAARWIEWILKWDRLAPYLQSAHRFPVTRGLIGLTVDAREYAAFLRDLMERGTVPPSGFQSTKQAETWRANIAAVWRGQTTPENAARNVEGAR